MNSETFKERLKEVMGTESNRSFATKCDISEMTLRRYLQGDTSPPLDTLRVIAEASGYSLGWLASGEGPMKIGEAVEVGAEDKKTDRSLVKQAAVSYIDAMTDVETTRVIAFIVEQQPAKSDEEEYDWPEEFDFIEHLDAEGKKQVWEILQARKIKKRLEDGDGLKLTGT